MRGSGRENPGVTCASADQQSLCTALVGVVNEDSRATAANRACGLGEDPFGLLYEWELMLIAKGLLRGFMLCLKLLLF